MTIAKDIAAKFAVAFVAAAMLFTTFAPAAKAQTTEDLQKMINDLLAQVASLQSQLGQGGSSAAGVCPYTWTRDLSSGATGADVMKLQQFLNADSDTRVAASGVGSAGSETEYYGPATAAAVSKFQVKYRSEILSPANLVNPTGYFGPSTRGKANTLCVSSSSSDDSDDDDDSSDDDDDSSNGDLSGEADLKSVDVNDPEDDTLQEGQDDVEIGTIDIEFQNGDAEISRIDLGFGRPSANTEDDPWDTFKNISLWVDGDKVAEETVDDRDDWLSDTSGSSTFRFSGLDIIAEEDDEITVTIAATLQKGMVTSGGTDTWEVYVTSMRFFDGEGVATTDSATGDIGDWPGAAADFTIEEEGGDDELVISGSTNDPDGQTLALESDQDSDWETIFIFEIDSDDSDNDIVINTFPVTVELSSSTYATIVDDAELIIDGVTISSNSSDVTATNTTDAIIAFDVDRDVTIEAGDKVEAELRVKFNSLATGNEGMTVRGRMTGYNVDAIDAEGADDITTTNLQGTATGEYHTLRLTGIEFGDFDSDVTVSNLDTADNNYGEYTLTVEVTAVGDDDIFIPLTDAPFDHAGATSTGVVYRIVGDSGNVASSTGTTSATFNLVSGGDQNGDIVRLDSGETATFELVVTFNPTTEGQYKVVLDGVGFSLTETSTAAEFEDATPDNDYDTASTYIQS